MIVVEGFEKIQNTIEMKNNYNFKWFKMIKKLLLLFLWFLFDYLMVRINTSGTKIKKRVWKPTSSLIGLLHDVEYLHGNILALISVKRE